MIVQLEVRGHYHADQRALSRVSARLWGRPLDTVSSSPMEPSIYEYPEIFRHAHLESPGEIPAEVEFLKQVWVRHIKRPVRRLLDIGCGDSPHGLRIARAGIDVVGIDRS